MAARAIRTGAFRKKKVRQIISASDEKNATFRRRIREEKRHGDDHEFSQRVEQEFS